MSNINNKYNECYITYIIATYNCISEVDVLTNTVSTLSDLPIEFVVSDGGSSDGTLDALRNIPDLIIACSSRDKGIYDAWNRALPTAKGKYIGFIGVDDVPQREFIQEAITTLKSFPDISLLYGDVCLKRNNIYRKIFAPETSSLVTGARPRLDIPHQGMLHSCALFKGNQFNSEFKIAGDLHFLLKARQEGLILSFKKLNKIQAVVDEDGVSRSALAWHILLPEYKSIENELCLKLGYSHTKTKILSFFRYIPSVFMLVKKISWHIRGAKIKNNNKI